MSIFDILKIIGAVITSAGVLGAGAVYILNRQALLLESGRVPFRCHECGNINTVSGEELHLVGSVKKAMRYTQKSDGALYPYYCNTCRRRTMQQLAYAPLQRPAQENFKKQLFAASIVILVGVVVLLFSFLFSAYFAAKTTGAF